MDAKAIRKLIRQKEKEVRTEHLEKLTGLPWQPEFRFYPKRLWKADFAQIDTKTIVEIEGGIWQSRGGHTTGIGFIRNIEKYNKAAELGWLVIRLVPMPEKPKSLVIRHQTEFCVQTFGTGESNDLIKNIVEMRKKNGQPKTDEASRKNF